MHNEAKAIQHVLNAHRVNARVLGPPHSFQSSALNIYRIEREAGVPVAAVEKLAPEIDEALTAMRRAETYCRILSTPLRVEVPRRDAQIISAYDVLPMIRKELGGPKPDRLLLLAGESVHYDHITPYLFDLQSPNTPHLFIAGTTGSGKTNLLLSMIVSLANLNDAKRLALVVLDPKGVGLSCLDGMPHLAGPVVTDSEKFSPVLRSVVAEMERRKKSKSDPSSHIVVAIDEVAELMDLADDEAELLLKRIMQLGRELGIHVIAATQKPTAAQIGSIIKANFPVRIVGAVASANDANVAAGTGGTRAEKLPGRGSFLVVKGNSVKSLQAYYTDKNHTRQLCAVNARHGFQPVWRYGIAQQRPVTPEKAHTYAYTADIPDAIPDSIPVHPNMGTTDLIPFEPLDRTGEQIVMGLYQKLGSKNAVIKQVWPNRYKQKCLEYISPVIDAYNKRKEERERMNK